MSGWLKGGLRPLDRLRRALYQASMPQLAPLIADRQLRVLVLLACYGFSCLAVTATVPLWMLALGPIVWGIPHVVADIRYLVVVPGYHRRSWLMAGSIPLVLWAGYGGGMLAGGAALGLAGALTMGSPPRRILVSAVGLLVCTLHFWARTPAELLFSHLHNGVALLWLLLLLPGAAQRTLLVAGFGLSAAWLMLAPLSWMPLGQGALLGPPSMGLGYHLGVLTPGIAPNLGLRLVLLFCFAQAFHYAIWVRLMPELLRRRSSPRGFAASYEALTRDLGVWPVLLILAAMVGLVAFAALDLRVSREAYLRFALFHGYLELVFLAVWWVEGRRWTSGRAHSH